MKSTYRMSLEVVSDICKPLLEFSVPRQLFCHHYNEYVDIYVHHSAASPSLPPSLPSPPLPSLPPLPSPFLPSLPFLLPTGEFGDVLVGNWYKPKSSKPIRVAVKTLKVTAPLTIPGCAPACACIPSHCPSLLRTAPRRRLVMTSSPKLLSWDSLTITMSFTCMAWYPNVSGRDSGKGWWVGSVGGACG